MNMFSQQEILLMIGVVSVLLVSITVLTILDIREYMKNKKNPILEVEDNEEMVSVDTSPVVTHAIEEKKVEQGDIEVFEVSDKDEVHVSKMDKEELNEIVEPLMIEVPEEKIETQVVNALPENNVIKVNLPEEAHFEEIVEPIKKETLSVQVNEVNNTSLEEELNKAAIVPEPEDMITSFEEEQERTAIISLDELMQKSDELYSDNEYVQYDDGNEPITIDEVINRFNENNIQEEVSVPEVMKNIVSEPKKELYTEKKTTPFISPLYGLEQNDNALAFENTASYEKLDRAKNNDFMAKLREISENKNNY